jgi:hypothetical protein
VRGEGVDDSCSDLAGVGADPQQLIPQALRGRVGCEEALGPWLELGIGLAEQPPSAAAQTAEQPDRS